MTRPPYTPRPGSTAERAAAYLLYRGPVLAAVLADAIECEPASALHANLSVGVTKGFFVKKLVDGLCMYSLGSEEADPAIVQRVISADGAPIPATTAAASVFHQVATPASRPEKIKAAPAPAPATESASPSIQVSPATLIRPGPFRCGIFSDGELHLFKGDQAMVLDRPELEKLLAFLQRMTAEDAN